MRKGIIGALLAITLAGSVAVMVRKVFDERIMEESELAKKHFLLFQMMNQWVKVKQAGKNLAVYFEKAGYKEIAIYGMHFAGETLLEELRGSDIRVKYGIDKNAEKMYQEVDVVTPDSDLDDVDVIVVTAITYFDEIEEMLRNKIDCPIVSLEDILGQV